MAGEWGSAPFPSFERPNPHIRGLTPALGQLTLFHEFNPTFIPRIVGEAGGDLGARAEQSDPIRVRPMGELAIRESAKPIE